MAAPHVAGVCALLMQVMRERGMPITSASLLEVLNRTTRAVGASWDSRFGRGRIDVAAAVHFAMTGVTPSATAAPQALTAEVANGANGVARDDKDLAIDLAHLIEAAAVTAHGLRARGRLTLDVDPTLSDSRERKPSLRT